MYYSRLHKYKEVVPKLLKFINLGHLIDIKTLKHYNIMRVKVSSKGKKT